MVGRLLLVCVTTWIFVGLLSACSGVGRLASTDSVMPLGQSLHDSVEQDQLPSFELPEGIEREFAAFETPAGVDEVLFSKLKDELARQLDLRASKPAAFNDLVKSTSAMEPGDLAGSWCLDARRTGTAMLTWRGIHLGDYDLNSEVNIADITPLAIHYMKNTILDADGLPVVNGDNELVAQADGDGNGEVNVADITPIALNFTSRIAGYRVYVGEKADGEDTIWQASFVPNADNAQLPYTVPYSTATLAGKVLKHSFEWTQPIPAAGLELWVKVVAFNGVDEGAETIIPLPSGVHTMFTCSSCHRLTDYEVRDKEASCYNCHSSPPEGRSTSWADAPGMHGNCNMCHGAHYFKIDDTTAKCAACHSSISTEVQAAGMPNCLSCHEVAHVPEANPGPLACQTCHSVPPDAESLAWADAPGLHGNCGSCHPKHGFDNAGEPNMCAQCHASQVGGGHMAGEALCTTCHNSVHVPEGSATGLNCEDCHPVPPEAPELEWTDAPGSHGNCVLCHAGTHGYKPTPAASICANCHQDTIDTGHAGGSAECLGCHTFPHIPKLPASLHGSHPVMEVNCVDCHDSGVTPRRDHCVACHVDRVEHYAPQVCQSCHPG